MGPGRNPVASSKQLPFDVDFQKSLLRLMTEDEAFGDAALSYLQPEYFETELLGWIYGFMRRFHEAYSVIPGLAAVAQEARNIDASIRPLYEAMIEEVKNSSLRDDIWLREATLDFVKRNVFVRAFHESRGLYNDGKAVEAYDHMMGQMDDLGRVAWEALDVEWHFDDLQKRQSQRSMRDPMEDTISTGFPTLDHVLGGGLSLGELGIFMAYAKIGKTTVLINLGIAATRRHKKVLHIVLEGSRKLVSDRYDAALMRESYHLVKYGQMNPSTYALALQDYQYYHGTLVIRSLVDKMDVTISDIDAELRRLDRNYNWRPDMIVVDYADLMTGRNPTYYRSETQAQRAAYRDLKRLTSRGYAIWTGSQAQRPTKSDMETQHILYSNSVADTYDKVRVADFFGSLNQTANEKNDNVMRLYYEMYRDAPAGQLVTVRFNNDIMYIAEETGLSPQKPAETPAEVARGNGSPLGYVQQKAI